MKTLPGRAALAIAACLFLTTFAVSAEPNTLTDEELAEGWLLLFDGETLFGWKAANDSDWHVEDGAITATKGSVGLIHTTSQWGNYVLKVDFRSAKGGNSGVFLRTPPKPDVKSPRFYEVNIADHGTNDYPTGSIVFRKACKTKHDSEDWQSFELTANGPQFTVKIDLYRRYIL